MVRELCINENIDVITINSLAKYACSFEEACFPEYYKNDPEEMFLV